MLKRILQHHRRGDPSDHQKLEPKMQKQTTPKKSTSVVESVTVHSRLPAAEAMANRGRLTIGEAYVRDVIAGVQRDWNKQFAHALALGLGTRAKLSKLDPKELRAQLATALQALKKNKSAEIPASITVDGEVLTVH